MELLSSLPSVSSTSRSPTQSELGKLHHFKGHVVEQGQDVGHELLVPQPPPGLCVGGVEGIRDQQAWS